MGLKPVSVSRLNAYIKRILQSDPILGNVSVIGEISNLKYHSTGHVYFTLKDENSKISCFLSLFRLYIKNPDITRREMLYLLNIKKIIPKIANTAIVIRVNSMDIRCALIYPRRYASAFFTKTPPSRGSAGKIFRINTAILERRKKLISTPVKAPDNNAVTKLARGPDIAIIIA